ncbi:MAG: acyl-CoA dehydrogenase family protein [Cyanobacteria bacterium J06649_4]
MVAETPEIHRSAALDSGVSSELESFLKTTVAPVANQLDTDSAALFETFNELGKKGLLTPKNPQELGGMALDVASYQRFQALVARYSGALAFLLTQHQSAASLLLGSAQTSLSQTYLPEMATGERRIGVGFSQLRRLPSPLQAVPVSGGYRLNGTVPWVTGADLFTHFVGAAVLPDGAAVFGLLPLVSQEAESANTNDSGRLTVGAPMALAAMSATNTVEVQVENWFLSTDCVVGHRPAGWISERDHANPLSPLGLMFGCSQASLDVLTAALARRQIAHSIAEQLRLKLAWLQMDCPRVMALPLEAYPQKLAFRGRAIALMNTCAQAAVVASSGAANGLHHPAQRIYKESLVFSVSGQTTDVAIATLNNLLSSA